MQGQGLMFDGMMWFFMLDGMLIYYYMGCLIFLNYIVLFEIVVVKVCEDVFFDKICYIGCGVIIGIGVVINIVKVEIGVLVVVFGLGGIGLNVIQGLCLVGVDKIIGVDLNNGKKVMVEYFGMMYFINLFEIDGIVVQEIVNMMKIFFDQIGGVDYFFDVIGSIKVMCDVLECIYCGWGVLVIIGVVVVGVEISIWFFQFVIGWVWKGMVFGGVWGWIDVFKIVDWYMDGKIEIDLMIIYIMLLEDINKGFELVYKGELICLVVFY